MKVSLLTGLVVACCTFAVQAEQTLGFPKKSPLITFDAPDGWKPQVKNGSLFVVSPDGGDVIVEVMAMDAASDDDAAALEEARGTVSEDFKNLNLTKSDPTEANGLIITLYGGEGTDSTGPAHINMALIKHPEAKQQILFSLIASKDKAAEHGAACGAMLNSISAAAAAAPAAKTQTFAYPDKEKPDFMIDFPAEWVMKATDEGAYVESDDKLVAMNVIMVPKEETEKATESLKASVAERFKAIEWNEGGAPEVNKDEDLGLVATFNNAIAHDGEGTEKYSVNLISYVRKSGDKTLVFLCQKPLRALKKHGDAMEAVIQSVKVR